MEPTAIAYLGRPGLRAGGPDDGPAVGLVPADRVSVVAIELPELRGARLAQALRWAAEDALAGQAEEQHVVPLGRRPDGRMACAVAARTDMQRWCAEAPALERLVPDAAALPWRDGELVLADAGESVLARWSAFGFDRLDTDLLDALLPDLVDQAQPEQIVWYADPASGDLPDSVAALAPDRRARPAKLEDLLAEQATRGSVDLLYGEFAPARERDRPGLRWTAALALLAVFLWIGDAAVEAIQLQQRAEALQAEVEARTAEAFPELVLLPGRERAQLERALQGRTGTSDGLVRVLGRISPLFAGLGGVAIESLRGVEGETQPRVELTLRAPGLPDLEALERQVAGQGLRAELDDIAVESDGVRARMTVTGAGR